MAPISFQAGLAALAIFGAVSAVPSGQSAALSPAGGYDSCKLGLFENCECSKHEGHSEYVELECDTAIPDNKHSIWFKENDSYEKLAAYDSWEKKHDGTIECCGEHLGYIEHGCTDVDKEFDCRFKCVRPIEFEEEDCDDDWEDEDWEDDECEDDDDEWKKPKWEKPKPKKPEPKWPEPKKAEPKKSKCMKHEKKPEWVKPQWKKPEFKKHGYNLVADLDTTATA